MQTKRSILVIGENSKLARIFISKNSHKYHVIGTYYNHKNTDNDIKESFHLNLRSSESIDKFTEMVKDVSFSAVLVFSSIYSKDAAGSSQKNESEILDYVSVHATSLLPLLKNINFTQNSKLILFGDSGLVQPHRKFSAYSVSKNMLSVLNKIIAVELSPKTSVITFNLGPVSPHELDAEDTNYHDHGLIKVSNPAKGLINLLSFIIREPNLYMSATEINYDGGAYTKRDV